MKCILQINGKKRGVIQTKKNINEDNLLEMIEKEEKISKYIKNNQIKKKIYIKNKLLNLII